jgi:hypothetical protein
MVMMVGMMVGMAVVVAVVVVVMVMVMVTVAKRQCMNLPCMLQEGPSGVMW